MRKYDPICCDCKFTGLKIYFVPCDQYSKTVKLKSAMFFHLLIYASGNKWLLHLHPRQHHPRQRGWGVPFQVSVFSHLSWSCAAGWLLESQLRLSPAFLCSRDCVKQASISEGLRSSFKASCHLVSAILPSSAAQAHHHGQHG